MPASSSDAQTTRASMSLPRKISIQPSRAGFGSGGSFADRLTSQSAQRTNPSRYSDPQRGQYSTSGFGLLFPGLVLGRGVEVLRRQAAVLLPDQELDLLLGLLEDRVALPERL